MQSKASTIREYIAGLSGDERAVIQVIDDAVRLISPNASGSMKYGMPTYEIGGRMFAFNSQKNYFAVYADPEIVKKCKTDLKALDVGKSCIRFRSRDKMPLEAIRRILREYGN